jgi:hypothetical protein
LPIRSRPEEALVATVRNDVINHVGNATAFAGAQTVLRERKELLALTLPLAIIATR